MSRRILHIIDSLARTGTARQLLLLSRGLAREGWDVHVAALRGAGGNGLKSARSHKGMSAEFAAARIPVVYLGRRWNLDPLADLALVGHVARLRPDVVHTWDSAPGLFGPVKIRQGGRPRIIAGLYHIDRHMPAWDSYCQRRFARHVDRFVTNSAMVRDWHVTRGLPAERFDAIPSGVKCSTDFSPSLDHGAKSALQSDGLKSVPRRDELLHELQLPPDARLIGVVGRLTHEKRVKDLIWAADLLRVLHDNLRVLIIGDGPQREQLERYARLASDLEHIRFLGERDDVERIMPCLDVLWNASENRGQSMAILEAMAAGVPVVASDTPTNRELVVENETGFLIPLGSRAGRAARARVTDRLLTDAELFNRSSNSAKQRAEQSFNVGPMVRRFAALYDE